MSAIGHSSSIREEMVSSFFAPCAGISTSAQDQMSMSTTKRMERMQLQLQKRLLSAPQLPPPDRTSPSWVLALLSK